MKCHAYGIIIECVNRMLVSGYTFETESLIVYMERDSFEFKGIYPML